MTFCRVLSSAVSSANLFFALPERVGSFACDSIGLSYLPYLLQEHFSRCPRTGLLPAAPSGVPLCWVPLTCPWLTARGGQPSVPAFPLKLSPVLNLLICAASTALLISHAAHHYFLLLFFPISGNDKYVF